MISKMALVRKRYIISGNVQEAGYRVLVKTIARSMGLVGFVRNLPDETVEVVCEAEQKTIERFLKAIDRKGDLMSPMDVNVVSMAETPPPAEGDFKKFSIEYNGKLSAEERERNREDREERMILGASMLNQKVDVVGQNVLGVGKAVEGVGQKVDNVGKAVHEMHSDMNKRFDHMAQRYDLIATSLVKAIGRIDRGFERMDQNSRKTDKAIEQSRKEVAASNRELAGAVKFMIKKLSGKPATVRREIRKKRK
jgi:acylphosphatase